MSSQNEQRLSQIWFLWKRSVISPTKLYCSLASFTFPPHPVNKKSLFAKSIWEPKALPNILYRLIFWLSNHSYLKYLSENHPNSPAPFGLMLPDSHRRTHSLAMHPAVLQHHFPWLHKILFHLLQNLQFCSIINLFNIQHPGVDSDKPGQKSAFDSKECLSRDQI